MIKFDRYPLKLSASDDDWRSPANRDTLSKLEALLPSECFRILRSVYLIGNGFKEGSYDHHSMVSLWPIEEALEFNRAPDSFTIGDYFLGADFVAISLENEKFPVFLLEARVELSSTLNEFFDFQTTISRAPASAALRAPSGRR